MLVSRHRLDAIHGGTLRSVLILVENLPVPFDRRVWQEACALRDAGYLVSVICPTGPGYESRFEVLDDVHIYRYRLPVEAAGAKGYAIEYGVALAKTFALCWRVWWERGLDVIQACNPPDLLFLIGAFFKLFGKKFVFDHHDLSPELYEAKFGRKGFFHRMLLAMERWTFRTANVSIATNESYRQIAIRRGRMRPENVFIVRSGPSLERLRVVPPDASLKRGRRFLVGYVGVMGRQEGIDDLLHAVRHIVHDMGRQDIHFGLVGGGTSLTELQDLAVQLEVDSYVTFTGRVPDKEMLAMLNTAEVCVNPDKPGPMNDLSTMNKIMEYMALGKPIVQFDLKEGRFSAQHASLYARCGDVKDFAEKIVQLVDDPARREMMGRFGRQRVLSQLQWRTQVPQLLDAYAALWPEPVPAQQQHGADEAVSTEVSSLAERRRA
jgi:glycosyltransferase involved in cell wall biosynthesis